MLGGGFFGSGASSSESHSRANEQAQQVGEGAQAVILNIEQGRKNRGTANVNLTTTDHGAIDDAFAFAGGTIESALGAIDSARSDSLQFAAGTLESTHETISHAMDRVYQANENARVDSLSFAAGSLETLLDSISDTTANTLGSLADAQSKTIATIGEQTKSEAAKSFDRVVTLAGIGFVLVAALAFYRKK